jgi:hypothetical protein
MEDIDRLIEKWGSLGFLDQLPEYKKPVLVILYERMAMYIISLDLGIKSYGEEMVESCVFPILYRIIKNNGHVDDIVSLYRDIVNFMNINKNRMEELQREAYFNIDIEAELCVLYTEQYINHQKDPIKPIKYIKGWEK